MLPNRMKKWKHRWREEGRKPLSPEAQKLQNTAVHQVPCNSVYGKPSGQTLQSSRGVPEWWSLIEITTHDGKGQHRRCNRCLVCQNDGCQQGDADGEQGHRQLEDERTIPGEIDNGLPFLNICTRLIIKHIVTRIPQIKKINLQTTGSSTSD